MDTISESKPAFIAGQALEALLCPHVPLVPGLHGGSRWMSRFLGGAGSSRTVGGCRLWSLKALDLTIWCERTLVLNWSIPTWPMRILNIQWGAWPRTTQPVSDAGVSHSGARDLTHWAALLDMTQDNVGDSGCCRLRQMVGRHSVNLSFFALCWPGAPCLALWGIQSWAHIGDWGGWMKLPALTSSLPSGPGGWLMGSHSPSCTAVHGRFLATGWWIVPGQDVYSPWRNGHRIKPALAWQPLAVLSSPGRPAKPTPERKTEQVLMCFHFI